MKLHRIFSALVVAVATCTPMALPLVRAAAPAAKVNSDISTPQKRQATVTAAEHLTRPPVPTPLPGVILNPFNPVDFEKPDPEDAKAAAAYAAANPHAVAAQPGMPGDREILESLAARLKPSGTIQAFGKTRLLINGKPFEVGTKFIVAYSGQDCELELTSIASTTFTLRYRGEEVTRSIKPVK
jgi:hypothetical protein